MFLIVVSLLSLLPLLGCGGGGGDAAPATIMSNLPATTTPPPAATPQPNVELTFFYDWNPQDPFNLQGTGLNSLQDAGEPLLPGFVIAYGGQNFTTDGNGIVQLTVPESAILAETPATIMITIPNTNKPPGQKDLAALGMQFTMTLYEPNRVNYGPNFYIDFSDSQCQSASGKITCKIGMADGYLTSPYRGENYLYSSPWTFDDGLNYQKDFVSALVSGQIPSPTGGMYQLGALGGLIAGCLNGYNQGAPYGYPYLLNDTTRGIMAHLLMDVRNDLGAAVYAPVGGTVCQGNSSPFAICAVDITIDVNDIRAVPGWQNGLKVKRGQLIGWTDHVNNIAGHTVPFPLIHMGHSRNPDRATTLYHFPYLTAQQIVMGARPNAAGQISLAPQGQVAADYNFRVHLPHAPVYSEN